MKSVFAAVVVLAAVATGAVRALHSRAQRCQLYGCTTRGVVHARGAGSAVRTAAPRYADPTHLAATPRHATRLRWALGAYRRRNTARGVPQLIPTPLRRRRARGADASRAPPGPQDARKLLQGPATQQSVEEMAAIGQAEHWAPWQPGTPWGTTQVVNGVVVQTSEEAAAQEAADAATMTPDQQQKARAFARPQMRLLMTP